MKKRLAIFTHGGIAGGLFSQGFPPMVNIVNRLSDDYNVDVYTHAPDKPQTSVRYDIYSAPSWMRSSILRWLGLVWKFVINNRTRKYDAALAFWGYPTGLVLTMTTRIVRVPVAVILLGGETANVPEIGYGLFRKPFRRKLILWMCSRVDALMTVSERQKKTLVANGVDRRIDVVPWGCDLNIFRPKEQRRGHELRILHVANLTEVKDQETLLKAFELIAREIPATLRIVGGDYLGGKLQALVAKMECRDKIEFIGPIPHQAIVAYYHWADMFLLTSLSEGQNSSLHEAMCCGCIPVSTDVGAMDYDFGEQVGIVVNCRDHQTLSSRVINVYQDSFLWATKRERSVRYARAHDLEWTVDQIGNVLAQWTK
ncbi:MAG TPA: glycosyltransferase [Chryseosolibacter sp.]|nr:glycosyltransferase [Chryseosolibacter sp.]